MDDDYIFDEDDALEQIYLDESEEKNQNDNRKNTPSGCLTTVLVVLVPTVSGIVALIR